MGLRWFFDKSLFLLFICVLYLLDLLDIITNFLNSPSLCDLVVTVPKWTHSMFSLQA
jgi:hypothetical protein